MRGKYADGVRISAWTASTHSTQDAANPTAQMDALADTQEGTEFEVSWGGSDDGSGVKDYTVQVKVDDGAWQTWLNDTASTSATYVGDFEHVYSFRVQARDQAHNVSAWSAETTTATPHTTVTKYYYLGGQRVAMRQDGELTYLHTDHLGSASLATDATGGVTSEMRYYPYGQTRSGTMDTDRQYTGQRWEAGIGLYDYNARYYDPALGRFVQADTIVPSMAHSQDFNRYSYVRNNPLKYTDPSGHAPPLLLIGVFLAGVALIVNGSTPLPAEQVPPPEQGFIGWSMILLPVAAWYAPTAAEGTGALLCADGDCINEIKTVGDVLCADGDCTNETEQIVDPLQQTLRTATSSPGQRTIHATTRKLQHEFKHASNFGLSGNWSKVMEQKFLDTLQAHVNGTNTVAIEGTYRGTQDVIHYYDPTTGLNVILDLHDNLVAAWQLSKKQIEYLFSNGNVQ